MNIQNILKLSQDFSKELKSNNLFPLKTYLEKILDLLLHENINFFELKKYFKKLYLIADETKILDLEIKDFLFDPDIKIWILNLDPQNISNFDIRALEFMRAEISGILKEKFYK